ncbi:MAG: hypothetical protein RJA36_2691 [Pseudomonadota bacterium]|jgi:hypothetical protein
MKTGATARLIQPEIVGEVKERRIVNDELELLLVWTENGQPVQRWFSESQLEEVPQ